MAPTPKSGDRRKSGNKPSLMVSLSVPPKRLREIISSSASTPIKEGTPVEETRDLKESPATPAAATPVPDNGSDSNAATPAAEGPTSMGPPDSKKKGVKRSAPTNGNNDGIPKPRGKPGPKKKPRLEDGTIDHSNAAKLAGHKLGPKANMGAINAGLRALDRSGAPCRKWARGGFTLKSFTGTVWEVPRWTAPPKISDSTTSGSETQSLDNSSSKENKENGRNDSGTQSNAADEKGDVESRSMASMPASSPAPMAITAAS